MSEQKIDHKKIEVGILPAEEAIKPKSIPLTFETFNPYKIPFQHRVFYDIKQKFDYSKDGVQLLLLSGSMGSGKSVLAAHLVVLHCLNNPNAFVGVGRLSFSLCKKTIFAEIIKQIPKAFKEGVHYTINKSEGLIKFYNGSQVQCCYWSDKQWERFRGFEFTMFVVDEGSENEVPDLLNAIVTRLGRTPHLMFEPIVLILTNPDEPEHWINTNIILKAATIDGKPSKNPEKIKNYHVYRGNQSKS